MKHSTTFTLLITGSMWSMMLLQDAHAYLDPGTGSFVLQLLVAGFITASLFFKRFWYWLKSLGKKNPPEDLSEPSPDDPPAEDL